MKRGFTCGAFDLCHAGHFAMLEEARGQCDYLIVGLHTDPSTTDESYRGKKKNKPILSVEERLTILKGIRYVDEIVTYENEENLYKLLKKLKPDLRIVGADWKDKKFTGHDLPMEVYYNSRNHGLSTSELRKRVHEAECPGNRLADDSEHFKGFRYRLKAISSKIGKV